MVAHGQGGGSRARVLLPAFVTTSRPSSAPACCGSFGRQVRGTTEERFPLARQQLRSPGRDGPDATGHATIRDRTAISVTLFDQARGELVRALDDGALEEKRPRIAVRALARATPRVLDAGIPSWCSTSSAPPRRPFKGPRAP